MPSDKVTPLLAKAGLRDTAAEAWRAMLSDHTTLTLRAWLDTPMARPFRHQILSTTNGTALIVTLSGDDGGLDLTSLATQLPGVSVVDKTASVSELLAQYRLLAALWLPVAGLLIFAVLA